MNPHYLIKIYWSDEDDAFVAEVPALPGCLSHGDTYAEAAQNIQESMDAWIESAQRHGDPVPEPDSLEAEVRKLAPILNLSEVARRSKINRNTLSTKIGRGTRFTGDESRRLKDVLAEISMGRGSAARATKAARDYGTYRQRQRSKESSVAEES